MKVKIDVILPTYNRYDLLPEFFKNNSDLNRDDVAVWIIDDCSTMMNESVIPGWSNISFIKLQSNQGQAQARNVAIEKSNGVYIISLDDDAWFENSNEGIKELVELFDKYPDAGCIMFNIATPDSAYSASQEDALLSGHVTCGCAYRREALEGVGGFSGFLHSGAEEADLSLRLYRDGWTIRYAKDVKVFHNFMPAVRPLAWYFNVRHNTTRNDLLIVVMYYPLMLVMPFLAGKFISHVRFAYKNKISVLSTVGHTFSALVDFFKLLPQAVGKRKALSLRKFRYWRSLSASAK